MKVKALLLALVLAPLSTPGFAGAVHLTTDLSADFLSSASATQVAQTFAAGDQPMLWGFGWELIPGRVGFGGDYQVSFSRDAASGWWLDWYAPALFLSYHLLGTRSMFDPWLNAGLGCAGRVSLSPITAGPDTSLSLALFPFLGGGLALNLDGLLLGVKAAWTPFKSPIPVTSIPAYPLGTFQVTFTAGISLGW